MKLIKYGLKFERLTFQERRDYFVNLIKKKTGITCEYKLYETLIRLTYIKKMKGYLAKRHKEDQVIADFLKELDLNAERAMNWFVYTKDKTDFKTNKKECDGCIFSPVCELKNKKLIESTKDKYNCKLAIKRIKKLILKKETFHDFLNSKVNYSEEEIRKILRKLFIYYRYKIGITLNEKDNRIIELLGEYGIHNTTALKWFYLVKDLEVLFKEALENIKYFDYNINKFSNLCLRILNLKGCEYNRTNSLYKIISTLEEIADEYRKLAIFYKPSKLSSELVGIFEKVNKLLEKFFEVFYKFSSKKLIDFAVFSEEVLSEMKQFKRTSLNETRTFATLFTILHMIKSLNEENLVLSL